MVLLAMTQFSFMLGCAAFAICLALIVYAVLPLKARNCETADIAWPSLLFCGLIESVALWVWLNISLRLLAWGFWIGDNDHPFYGYVWLLAAVIAVAVSGIVSARIYRGSATSLYRRIHFWVPLGLLLAFAVAWVHESTYRIEAFTADAAAQKVFARLSRNFDEPVSFRKDEGEALDDSSLPRCKTFLIMDTQRTRAEFTLCPHKWFGW